MAITARILNYARKYPARDIGGGVTGQELNSASGVSSPFGFYTQEQLATAEQAYQDLLKLKAPAPTLPDVPTDEADMARRRTRLDEQRRRGRLSTILAGGQYAMSGMPDILGGQTLLGGM